MKTNHPSEIYDLKTVNKTLFFGKSEQIETLYLEATVNDVWVDISFNPLTDLYVMTVLDKPKNKDIAVQMVYACKADKEAKLTYTRYTDTVKPASLRTALYNCAKELKIPVKTGIFGDTVYCYYENTSTTHISHHLTGMNIGDSRSIHLSPGSNVLALRTAAFNYAKRHDWKISTKVIGNVLRVKRELVITKPDTSEALKQWADKMPWDVPIPLPKHGFSSQYIRVTLNRYKPGVFTVTEETIMKNSLSLCKYEGSMCVFIRGCLVQSFTATKRTELTDEDIGRINYLVSGFNKSYEDL